MALLLRAHFSIDIAETAAHEPILFGALKETKVLNTDISMSLAPLACISQLNRLLKYTSTA